MKPNINEQCAAMMKEAEEWTVSEAGQEALAEMRERTAAALYELIEDRRVPEALLRIPFTAGYQAALTAHADFHEGKDNYKAMYEAANRHLWALAEGEFRSLATINEDYQGAVDDIIGKLKDLAAIQASERGDGQ